MKEDDTIYSFDNEFYDLWHYKIADEPVNKGDSFTAEDFAEMINEPFEVYEKHIRAIEYEKRIAHISVETPTDEFPIQTIQTEIDMSESFPGVIFKRFVGEYDDAMKEEIRKYKEAMGYAGLRMEEHEYEHIEGYSFSPYSCNVFGIEHTLGFYFTRHGLLRNCLTQDISSTLDFDDHVLGDLRSFKLVEEILDKKYIEYMYGSEGLQRLMNYYQKNFVENFEYGLSVLHLNFG